LQKSHENQQEQGNHKLAKYAVLKFNKKSISQ